SLPFRLSALAPVDGTGAYAHTLDAVTEAIEHPGSARLASESIPLYPTSTRKRRRVAISTLIAIAVLTVAVLLVEFVHPFHTQTPSRITGFRPSVVRTVYSTQKPGPCGDNSKYWSFEHDSAQSSLACLATGVQLSLAASTSSTNYSTTELYTAANG